MLWKGIKTPVLTVTAKETNILCNLLGKIRLGEENGSFHSITLEISKASSLKKDQKYETFQLENALFSNV